LFVFLVGGKKAPGHTTGNAEVRKALAVPDLKSKLVEAMGGDPRATTPDETKARYPVSTRPGRSPI
jgi:hypothetical protein